MKKLFLLGMMSAGCAFMAEAQIGDPIGKTAYDLQSNGSSGNRLVRHADGTISATWIEICDVDPLFTYRGAGYNYFDGSSWIHGADGTCDETGFANHGVASEYVGWPEIASFASGKEFIVSHTPLKFMSRPQKGTGGMAAWSATAALPVTGTTEANTWPRMVVDRSDNVGHLIASNSTDVNGVVGGIAYFRSTDEGATWTEVALPGMDGSSFNDIGGDNYAIHANGGTVAITAGSFESDWVMWKSTNAGASFTKTIIRKFDPTDTVITTAGDIAYSSNDGFHAILVDNSARVHAWSGAFDVAIDEDASMPNGWTTVGIYPQTEGLFYWNDGMATDDYIALVEEREHIPGNGHWVGNGSNGVVDPLINSYQGSYTGMPNAALATNGDIYLVYSGILEGTSNSGDSTGQSFRDLYVMRGTNGGANWEGPLNLGLALDGARGEYEEAVFPSVAHEMGADNLLHILWQQDDEPGLHVRIDLDPQTVNTIMYRAVDVTTLDFTLSTKDDVAAYVNAIEAYPNPTNGVAKINLDLKANSNIMVQVTNLLGQVVATIPARDYFTGPNEIRVDLSAQSSGVYLYSIIANDFTVTKRLVKQ